MLNVHLKVFYLLSPIKVRPVVSPSNDVEVELAGDEDEAGGQEDHGQTQDWEGEGESVEGGQAGAHHPD